MQWMLPGDHNHHHYHVTAATAGQCREDCGSYSSQKIGRWRGLCRVLSVGKWTWIRQFWHCLWGYRPWNCSKVGLQVYQQRQRKGAPLQISILWKLLINIYSVQWSLDWEQWLHVTHLSVHSFVHQSVFSFLDDKSQYYYTRGFSDTACVHPT